MKGARPVGRRRSCSATHRHWALCVPASAVRVATAAVWPLHFCSCAAFFLHVRLCPHHEDAVAEEEQEEDEEGKACQPLLQPLAPPAQDSGSAWVRREDPMAQCLSLTPQPFHFVPVSVFLFSLAWDLKKLRLYVHPPWS